MKKASIKIPTLIILVSFSIYSQTLQQEQSQQSFWLYVLVILILLAALGSIIWAVKLKKESEEHSFISSKPKTTSQELSSENTTMPTSSARKQEVNPTLLLPVFISKNIPTPKPLAPLPLSNDEGLLSAIEEIEMQEEDEELRLLSLKVLAAFRTRNSVEALTKVIHSDPSDEVKIKAIQILSAFNHESAFEPILLACADVSKRVRAAAVQALSRLNIDRADAWMRILQSDDPERIRLCARAAIESGFAERVFERLVSKDFKQAKEAIALIALLIEADETTIIFRRLSEEKDLVIQKAILHVIKLTKSEKALGGLYLTLDKGNLPEEIKEEIDEIIESISLKPS